MPDSPGSVQQRVSRMRVRSHDNLAIAAEPMPPRVATDCSSDPYCQLHGYSGNSNPRVTAGAELLFEILPRNVEWPRTGMSSPGECHRQRPRAAQAHHRARVRSHARGDQQDNAHRQTGLRGRLEELVTMNLLTKSSAVGPPQGLAAAQSERSPQEEEADYRTGLITGQPTVDGPGRSAASR